VMVPEAVIVVIVATVVIGAANARAANRARPIKGRM